MYYGDETARPLVIKGAQGDANLRSFMNWEALQQDSVAKATFAHWSKLARFRKEHLSVGDGKHTKHQEAPYVFSRKYQKDGYTDQVLVALDAPTGTKTIPAFGIFAEGTTLKDYYSGQTVTVKGDTISLNTPFSTVLLALER